MPVSVTSPFSLYSAGMATFDEDDCYDQSDSAGFIHLYGLPLKVRAIKAKKNRTCRAWSKLWQSCGPEDLPRETDHSLDVLNASLPFDQRLYRQDITGSMAHAKMLARQGIISAADGEAIVNGLQTILDDIEAGKLIMEGAEDIHTFVEQELTARIGDAGKRLHTAPFSQRSGRGWTCACMSRKRSRPSVPSFLR